MNSKIEKIREITKCGTDPIYFIKKYVYIQHPVKGRIKFETYPFQNDVVKALQNNRFNIVLKSRQLGLSTIGAAYALWDAIFHKDRNIVVIATKLETAHNFVKKVKIALEGLPPWLVLPKHDHQKTTINFTNGSRITSIPTSPDAGRSEAISLLIVDEAAFIRDFSSIWVGLSPTISTGGRAFILSTPNGVGNQFYKLWSEGVSGLNGFNTISLPWTVHPEHDETWYKEETKNLTKRQIAQEFNCNFQSSGATFLNSDDLDWLRSKIRDPLEKKGYDRNVWIWGHPEKNKRYVISADIARGDGSDYSTFHIIDADDGRVDVEYMGKAPPERMGQLMDEFGRSYNNALAIPENNTFGYTTAVYLRDEGYPNLYYEKNKADLFDFVPSDDDGIPGFSTQKKSRLNILTKLEELIRNRMITSCSARLVQQLQTFVWIGAKPQALKDSHDDLIISIAIGMYIVGSTLQVDQNKSLHSVAMLMSTSRSTTQVSDLPMLNEVQSPVIQQTYANVAAENRIVQKPRGYAIAQRLNPNWAWLLSK